jgi:hypothetical protein
MSTDYYTRIEQQRGPQPSEQMLAAIARGLHLSLDERDHLFRIGGHPLPRRVLRDDHLSPGHAAGPRPADLGVLELWCQYLLDPDQDQVLVVFTAAPGSSSYEKLQLLSAVG